MSNWRIDSLRVIDAVIERVGTSNLSALEREIRAAYPFGERANHPYKIWCDEVRRCLHRLKCAAPEAGLFAAAVGEGEK